MKEIMKSICQLPVAIASLVAALALLGLWTLPCFKVVPEAGIEPATKGL